MRYIKLCIKNLEPLNISDDSTSQSGQTNCCKYIPGSTIRGYVINKLSKNAVIFSKYKKTLFSDQICFLNAYPADKDKELIPSLKGFYEDKKADGNIKNVVIDGKFDEGMKRAGLGDFCYKEGNTVRFYSIETGSLMKIKIGSTAKDQKVFRGKHIEAGYSFVGYIAIDETIDKELENEIKTCFDTGIVSFGNMRSQGFGKCSVSISNDSDDRRPVVLSEMPQNDIEGDVYMILLSGMVMRGEYGEYCGINLETLSGSLGVSDLEIMHCATSMVTMHGYNKTIGSKMPTVPMYEQGSVFHLKFSGTLTTKKMNEVANNGIGERRNEGFGRVLFYDVNYSEINKKCKCTFDMGFHPDQPAIQSKEDQDVLKLIAGFYYKKILADAMQRKLPEDVKNINITKSQAGTVLSILENNRFNNSDINKTLKSYFDHAAEKEENQSIQKNRSSISSFACTITRMLNSASYGELVGDHKDMVMGFKPEELLSAEETARLKIEYVIDLIKYAGREN